MKRYKLITAASALLVSILSAAASAAEFRGLGDLPGGTVNSRAYGVTNAGVVAGWGMSASGQEAYRWTAATGMQPLGDFSSGIFASGAHAISADGSILGGFGTDAGGTIATEILLPGPVLRTLGTTPSYRPTWINGLSADGVVSAGFSSSGRAFRADATSIQPLPNFPSGGAPSDAMAVSADGSTVVGWGSHASGIEAFRYTTSGGMQLLGDLVGNDYDSRAMDVSGDGSVVVGWSSSAPYGTQAFRWTPSGGIVGLQAGGTFYPRIAQAVSDDGNVIVGSGSYLVSPFNNDPFIWDPINGTRNLRLLLIAGGADLSGWSNLWVEDISPDGSRIVGYGTNPGGAQEAFIATIPEPAAASVLVLLGASLLRRCPRRRVDREVA